MISFILVPHTITYIYISVQSIKHPILYQSHLPVRSRVQNMNLLVTMLLFLISSY